MNFYLCKEFLADLRGMINEPDLLRQTLKKLFDEDGSFRAREQNDHRFDGIENAWIRYITQGRTGYRAIFIRSNEDNIYLYRAGRHQIEDHLLAPKSLASAISVPNLPGNFASHISPAQRKHFSYDLGECVMTTPDSAIRHQIMARNLIPHSRIYLISPHLDNDLLLRTSTFTQMIFRHLEEGSKIELITREVISGQLLDRLKEWVQSGISVQFCKNLNANIFAFFADRDSENFRHEEHSDLVLVGSASLTRSGLDWSQAPNEEVCYRLPSDNVEAIENVVIALSTLSVEADEFWRKGSSISSKK